MLKFARNKLITVHRKDDDTLMVRGVLEDDIYGLVVTADVRLSDLCFLTVVGEWIRYTTPECPRALEHISEAEGLCIDSEIEQKLHKTVGRKGCRHYVTLLIECCHSVRETVLIHNWKAARRDQPELSFEAFLRNAPSPTTGVSLLADGSSKRQDPVATPGGTEVKPVESPDIVPLSRPSSGGFVIDLHTHSYPASPCAGDAVDEIIQEARRIGLDGICLTDHNFTWSADQLEGLRQKHGFLVLGGNEVTTDQGHMVVFGLAENPGTTGLVKLADLSPAVRRAGGFLIVSHPFRGFLTFGVGQLGLTVEKASARPLFKLVDGVEVLNGMVTEEENRFAGQVCRRLGLPSIGGSDAHSLAKLGCYATEFPVAIHNETELVAALKTGDYRPVVFRETVERAVTEQGETT